MDAPHSPIFFQPILKRLIWGGRRLATILHKQLGPEHDYAESWEISDHRDDVSQVADGPLAGATLRALVREQGRALLGKALRAPSQFPLLVKFLDANDVLSVQVHPDDERARRLANDNGKTECWVIVYAEPGSLIYAGLRAGVTRESFRAAIESGQVEPQLHRFEARAGDCIMIPAGTVHAIGAGVVMAEIQQMSDATFRVYDWGRTGPDGKPRTLHIPQALESIDFAAGPVNPIVPAAEPMVWGTREALTRCPYFALERLRLRAAAPVGSSDRFTILMGLGGRSEIRQGAERFALAFGQTQLLPAAAGLCEVAPVGDESCVLTCVVP